MPFVEARIKAKGKNYEISVDLDEALKIKKGLSGNLGSALQTNNIFTDLKKGMKASSDELESSFGTSDIFKIAEKIIKDGEVQKTQEYRDEEREKKVKQVVAIILKNAVDQHGKPYTEERLRNAIQDAHYSFDNRPAEQQVTQLLQKLKEIIPIKIEMKKIKLTIPAQYTGHVYGVIAEYKESEEWLSNGSLEAVLNVPSGMLLDFYDKVNHVTHGAVHSEELSSN